MNASSCNGCRTSTLSARPKASSVWAIARRGRAHHQDRTSSAHQSLDDASQSATILSVFRRAFGCSHSISKSCLRYQSDLMDFGAHTSAKRSDIRSSDRSLSGQDECEAPEGGDLEEFVASDPGEHRPTVGHPQDRLHEVTVTGVRGSVRLKERAREGPIKSISSVRYRRCHSVSAR